MDNRAKKGKKVDLTIQKINHMCRGSLSSTTQNTVALIRPLNLNVWLRQSQGIADFWEGKIWPWILGHPQGHTNVYSFCKMDSGLFVMGSSKCNLASENIVTKE